MKFVIIGFAAAFILIAGGMFHLINQGVSIRTAPQIKPTLFTSDNLPKQLAENLYLRLFPELQNTDYWWVGIEDTQISLLDPFFALLRDRMVQPITLLKNANEEAIQNCNKPCWIFLDPGAASELSGNRYLRNSQFQKSTTLTFLEFQRDLRPRAKCLEQKRLSLDCLTEISVNEVRKKIKEPGQYFFMRKYLDRDYFFLQESSRN